MSGPIVRSGPSTKFSENWTKVFGKKSASAGAKKSAAKATASNAKKKTAKKKAGKKR